MFCSRCPTWNSIYIRRQANLQGVEKILLRLEHIEFKVNLVICVLLRMPYSVQQYVLLEIPYLEQYLYTKLGRSTRGREVRLGNAVIRSRAFLVGHAAIQSYPKRGIATGNVPLQILALSGTRLRIKSYSGWKNRDAEKYYMNFYSLLHENLFLQNLQGDITVTNILLPEIAVSSFDTYIYANSQVIAKMIVEQ